MTVRRDKNGTPYWEYLHYLRSDQIDGFSSVDKFGHNLDLDDGVKETLWEIGSHYSVPNSLGHRLSIISTSSNDTAGGTGVGLLEVSGVGSGWVEQTRVYSLNGGTAVFSDDHWLGINRAVAFLAGEENHATASIDGWVHTATSSVHLFKVASGDSITHQCIYYVPKGKTAYVDFLQFNGAKLVGGSGTPSIKFELEAFITLTNAKYHYFTAQMDTAVQDILRGDRRYSGGVPEKSMIQVTGESDTNNTYAYAQMDITLVDN